MNTMNVLTYIYDIPWVNYADILAHTIPSEIKDNKKISLLKDFTFRVVQKYLASIVQNIKEASEIFNQHCQIYTKGHLQSEATLQIKANV